MPTNVVGIVRFSVISTVPRPFKLYETAKSFEQIAATVLDDSRMQERFRLFEAICLPSLDWQSDRNFKILIVAPRLMPDKWKIRLYELLRGRRYLDLVFMDETNFTMDQTGEYIREKLLPREGAFYTFRLDDDDALALDFVERTRKYIDRPFANHGLSFCKGFFLDISAEGYRIQSRVVPNLAVGFGYIATENAPRTIFEVSELHHRSHYRFPVITDATRNSWVAVTHAENDSGDDRRVEGDALAADDAAWRLRKRGVAVELELYEKLRTSLDLPDANSMRDLTNTLRNSPRRKLAQGLELLRQETEQEAKIRMLVEPGKPT